MSMYSNPFSLEGKVVMVTGASSGIGRHCAISCALAGAQVILIGRNETHLDETLECMVNKDSHIVIKMDLTNYQQVSDIVEVVVKKKGPISGLINCAGISATLPLKLVSVQKMEEMFHANVYSAYNLTKEVCKMGHHDKKGCSIIFISSVMGVVGEVAKSLYAMSKGALISGTRSLACELSCKNIRVNSISPGVIITHINEHLPHIADPEKRRKIEDKHLLGLGMPEDIANASVFLLSDGARWITGHNLIVDGGYTVR